MTTVKTECSACRGTGLYVGFAEGNQEAVICLDCSGSGAKDISYTPYAGRKVRSDVRTVRQSRGRMLFSCGGGGSAMTYKEFCDKVPQG